MGNVIQNVTSTTTDDELQEKNGQEHQRVYDPVAESLMNIMIKELREIKNEIFLMRNGE